MYVDEHELKTDPQAYVTDSQAYIRKKRSNDEMEIQKTIYNLKLYLQPSQ